MSDFQPVPAAEVNQAGQNQPPAPKNRRSWAIPAAVAVVAASIGYGAAGGAAAAPEPEVITETKEVEVIKEVEVPVETIVEVAPPACIEALNLAADGFEIAAGYIGLIEPAARAGMNQDIAAIERITATMAASNVELQDLQPLAAAASAECRAADGANS